MAIAIKVPSVGESVSEGILSQWLKEDGEFVEESEPLFELETDKATQEIPAPASGVLHISVSPGESVEIGSEVGSIDPDKKSDKKSDDEKPDKKADKEKSEKEKEEKAKTNETPKSKTKEEKADKKKSAKSSSKTKESKSKEKEPPLSPSLRRLVNEKGVDPSEITGTGRGGRITREDVMNYIKEEKPTSDEAPPPMFEDEEDEGEKVEQEETETKAIDTEEEVQEEEGETREQMSSLRLRIAERMLSSQQNTATLTTFNEADMSAVLAMRSKYKELFQEKHDIGLGFMSFFVKACVEALKAFPRVNGRIEDNEIVTYHHHHIGVAVSTDRGLVVPVVKNAGRKSFAGVEKNIVDLANKARKGKISYEDLQGGTFTITNGGIFGSLLSTPILNPPQSGILGMHTIQKRPVVVNDEIVIRPMMYLALSYDHRLIDGREAVQFLIRVKECIENPERILLGI